MEVTVRESRTNFEEYMKTWRFGSLLDIQPGERLSAQEVKQRLLRRAYADEALRRELLTHARYVLAIAIEEGLGIDRFEFVSGVKRVIAHEETHARLYLKLPACHRGCASEGLNAPPEGQGGDSCHVCGLTFPQASGGCDSRAPRALPQGLTPSRRMLEERIREAVLLDPAFRSELLARPLETYTEFVRRLCAGELPPYLSAVREVEVFEEADDEIHLVIPTLESLVAEGQAGLVTLS